MPHHKYQYVVICRHCGIEPLTKENYMRQLSYPNSGWRCPSCGEKARWDDECLETNPVVNFVGPTNENET